MFTTYYESTYLSVPSVYTILIRCMKRKLKILVSWTMGNGCTRTWYLEKAFCNDCSRSKIDAIWVLDLGYVCNTHMNRTCTLNVQVNMVSNQSMTSISFMLQDRSLFKAFHLGLNFYLQVDHYVIPRNVFLYLQVSFLQFLCFSCHHNLISNGNYKIHDATIKSMPNGNSITEFMIPPLKAYPMAIVNCHALFFWMKICN